MSSKVPHFLQPFLWSYDLSKIDKKEHGKIIIKNVLDFGSREAINWLQENYTEAEIRKVIAQTTQTQWSKKSINLWTLVYETSPKKTRF